jgi:rubrerythrin
MTETNETIVVPEEETTVQPEEKALDEKRVARAREHTLCELVKKDFQKKHLKEYKELVREPVFVCKKCGRAANNANYLCKPSRLIKTPVEAPVPEE